MVERASRLRWCLGPRQDDIPRPCSWGTSRETPPTVRGGTCSLVRRWSLGSSSSLGVRRLVWQQLRSEAQSRNQSTLSAKKILIQPRERRERLTWPSPGSGGGHSGLRVPPGPAHVGYPVSTCWVLVVLGCSFFAFILPHPAPPAVCSLYSPFHEQPS